jgi:hypothetical protein
MSRYDAAVAAFRSRRAPRRSSLVYPSRARRRRPDRGADAGCARPRGARNGRRCGASGVQTFGRELGRSGAVDARRAGIDEPRVALGRATRDACPGARGFAGRGALRASYRCEESRERVDDSTRRRGGRGCVVPSRRRRNPARELRARTIPSRAERAISRGLRVRAGRLTAPGSVARVVAAAPRRTPRVVAAASSRGPSAPHHTARAGTLVPAGATSGASGTRCCRSLGGRRRRASAARPRCALQSRGAGPMARPLYRSDRLL